jgi:heme oxygenase
MLSSLVKEASKEAHQAAERSPFMFALMRGDLNADAYRDYITQLAAIYQALEAWDDKSNPWPLFDRRLDRFERVICDIESLGGSFLVVKSTSSYAEHISALVSKKDWVRLLAHHYTRYLGDLSGGQAIAALVMRNIMIPPNFLSMYEFDSIGDKVRYKETYRQEMDSLDFSEEETKIFIDEVIFAFQANQAIFTELGERWLS